MANEMDLLSGLKTAEPVRPHAFEEARATLRAAIATQVAPETITPIRRRARWSTRRTAGFGVLALGAAAAAVTLVVTSAPAPSHHASASGTPTVSRSQPPAASSPLVSLAALIVATSGSLPGNASLIIRTQTEGTIPPQVSYNLYTDGGAFYVGGDKPSLIQAVAQHQNMADGLTAREVKAALYAAAGNLDTARVQMTDATPNDLGLGLPLAEREQIWAKAMAAAKTLLKEKGVDKPLPLPTGKVLQQDVNNAVWNNSADALSAGAGNPRVRAGVLRLLSTIPGVTVTDSKVDGQSALTLTAGPAVFGTGKQVLTINARTGMPISWWVGQLGPKVPSSLQTFRVLRLTMADIKAGKF